MPAKKSTSGTSRYRKTTLRNGLRVVTEHLPSVRSISLGVWIDVGSRFEHDSERGASHFIEHMFFKGTKKRKAAEIASALESVGGTINAFTSRENTCYTCRILDEHLDLALDVLADITMNSRLTKTNLDRERQVICEEIKESIDTPSDHIHDLFSETFWQGHPIGRPIMGTIQSISSMPRSRLTGYINRNYRSGSIVIAATGSVSHDTLVRKVRKVFGFPEGEATKPAPAARESRRMIITRPDDNAQTHVSIGFPGIPYRHPLRIPVLTLNSYLGGGMSSVLFQKIREQRGLAYTVFSFHDFFSDAGVFGTYLATDGTHVRQAVEVILAEQRRLKKRAIASSRLDRVKNQLKGHLVLGMESTGNRMNRIARQELMLGGYQSISQTLEEIDKVTPGLLREAAELCLDEDQLALAVLGPVDRSEVEAAL